MKSIAALASIGVFAALACQSNSTRAPSAQLSETSGLGVVTILARGME
jgi:hypothetical protein